MGTKLSLKKQKAALLNQIEVQLRKLNTSILSHKLNNVRIYLSLKFENLATTLTTVETAKEIKNNAALINQLTAIVNLVGQEATPLVNHNYQFAANELLFLQLAPLTNTSTSLDAKKSNWLNFIQFFRKNSLVAQITPLNEILITNYRIINTDIKNSFVLNKKQITNIYYDLQLNSLNIETTPTRHYALELNQQDLLKTLITLDYLKFI